MGVSDVGDLNLYALVMAGGKGTRFWPESTSKRPKQYLKLLGDHSLLANTLRRFDSLISDERRYIVTIKEQAQLVEKDLEQLSSRSNVIYEPSGRNTAPCILLSLAHLLAQGASKDDVVVIVPADHVILNTHGFQDVIREAYEVAYAQKRLVTIGIPPSFPHTGFGYIHRGESFRERIFQVDAFKEKPDRETAQEYVASGEYYWNAGIFVGCIGIFLREFERYANDMFIHFQSLTEHVHNFSELSAIYNLIPKNSIDYAVMEKSDAVIMIEARFDWNDLGSWDALETVLSRKKNNTWVAASDSYVSNASGNIVYAPEKFVALVGVNDLIVVANDDCVLVLPKKESQSVKQIVDSLKDHPLAHLLT